MKKTIALIIAVLVLLTTLFSNVAFAANEPAFVAGNAAGKAGDTVEITVSTANNSGIISAKVLIAYDANVLQLVSAAQGTDLTGADLGPTTQNPFIVNWEDTVAPENITTNGVMATLTFKILDTAAAGRTYITLTYDPDDVYDYDFNNVEFATVAGCVTVESSEVDFPSAVTNKGSSIRLDSTNTTTGLRFGATLSKTELGIEGEYNYSKDADVIFGTLMIPKNILEKTGYLSIKELYESGNKNMILDVVAKNIWAQDATTLTYTAVLTDVPEKGWNTTICAVPYMLKDGKFFFGDQMENSYYAVAKSARETDYSDETIAKITDPNKKTAAQVIANKLQSIIDKVNAQG